MKKLLLFLLVIQSYALSQVVYQDFLNDNSIYTQAPEEIRNRKPFIREWKFFDDRAYPDGFIPQDAYVNAVKQKNQMRLNKQGAFDQVTWVSLGPTSGYYFSWGNISSRIVTAAFHPFNTDIIYIGPANGGVWKTTNGGINWTALTDDQPSLSMGCIVIDPVNPDIIYAGTGEATYSGASYYGAGLLKSTDGGNSWTHITSGLPNQTYFSRMVIRPGSSNELLAALGNSGLYRSTNSGASWSSLVSGRCDDVLFSQSGDTAFIVGSGTGLRRSVDGGLTFQTFGTGLLSGVRTHFDYCKAQPSVMYAAIHASSTVYSYKSTNYGQNWSQVSTSFSGGGQAWYDLYCKVHPVNPDIAYVGIIDVFRTTNGGTSFSNITDGYGSGNVHVDQHNLFFHPNDPSTIIVLNDGGIYKSTNGGNSFINLNQNLTLTQFYRIAANPSNPSHILGGTQDNGTQQTYSSINWSAAFGGDGGEVAFNRINPNYIIGEAQNGNLSISSNGGSSWQWNMTGINSSEAVAWVAPIIAHPTENGVFYCARQKVYKTTNNGLNWTAISSNVYGTNSVRELAISYSNPLIMYASAGSKVLKSVDGGSTWTLVSTGLPAKTVSSVQVHPSNPDLVISTHSGFGTPKVYKSTNGGTSWTSIHGNLPDSPVNDCVIGIDPDRPDTYFIGSDVGVFVTTNNGANWTELSTGLPNTVILHLDYYPSTQMLRAGTHGRGVYEAYVGMYVPVELVSFIASVVKNSVVLNWTTSTEKNNRGFEIQRKLKNQDWVNIAFTSGNGTSTEENTYSYTDIFNDNSYEGKVLYRLKQVDFDGSFEYSGITNADVNFIPNEIVLHQNFPNPFNPVTNIAFSVPEESQVKLVIYNQLGEEVTLLTNKLYSPGIYSFQWDASSYTSGVYYYSLESKNSNGDVKNISKKLLLMK
jgi:photosystem II stability/assembly factor-like uncharacterized protein